MLFSLRTYSQTDSLKLIWENEEKTDSIRFHALQLYFQKNARSQPDSVLKSSDYRYDLAKKKNNKNNIVYAIKDKATIYASMHNYEKALSLSDQGIALAKEYNIRSEEAGFQSVKAIIYYHQRNFLEAIKSTMNALEIFQELKNDHGIRMMSHNLGAFTSEIGNYDMALEYFLDYYWKNINSTKLNDKNKSLFASNRYNIAEIYFEKKRF
jgi:tetratricopeptide (TPR) repeat protein